MNGSISGYVVRNGRGVADATVSIASGVGTYRDLAAVTDIEGWFVFDGLEPGEWVLSAYDETGSSASASAHVFDASMSDMTIDLR